jgi:hypothetical protein
MPDTTELSELDLPRLAPLLSALMDESIRRAGLAGLQAQLEEARSGLIRATAYIDGFCDALAQGAPDARVMARATGLLRTKKQLAKEALGPQIDAVERMLSGTKTADLRQALEKARDIAVGWLKVYDSAYERLLDLAAEKRGILKARPIEGEIDYAELSREHIARYPKIRAALAK